MRDGSLPPAAFQTWLLQDYRFVSDLLRFQARLLSVAPRAGQRALAGGLAALEGELGWFENLAKRLRLQLDVERHPVTEAYRQRLLSYAEDWAPGITALWTGERAYLESWCGVAPSAPAYREFVDHWTHPDFGAYVRDLERLVDACGPDEEAFHAICGLERDFWEMAWNSARA
jgi:thiaminase/transcriptional activator TenA